MSQEKTTYSVSEINSIVRGMLETRLGTVRVRGEISNLSRPASGHFYFTLKDKNAQIRCALFKNRRFGLRHTPENGQEVVASGLVSLYEARGDYQMIVEGLEPAGEGELQQQYEALKKRLHAEGLFDTTLKRSLPPYPRQLAIITSASGAALQDILHVLDRRFPALKVLLYPVSVQGDESEAQLINALLQADSEPENDVILLSRGGGSIEDLWSFNSEKLARLIVETSKPVVTGIGHEIDFTIADFAADHRAPTPSAAAELISPDGQQLTDQFAALAFHLERATSRQINVNAQHTDRLTERLWRTHPLSQIRAIRKEQEQLSRRLRARMMERISAAKAAFQSATHRLDLAAPLAGIQSAREKSEGLEARLTRAMAVLQRDRQQCLATQQRTLNNLAPKNTLARGYAIVRQASSGEIVRNPRQTPPGSTVAVDLAEGSFIANVDEIKPDGD